MVVSLGWRWVHKVITQAFNYGLSKNSVRPTKRNPRAVVILSRHLQVALKRPLSLGHVNKILGMSEAVYRHWRHLQRKGLSWTDWSLWSPSLQPGTAVLRGRLVQQAGQPKGQLLPSSALGSEQRLWDCAEVRAKYGSWVTGSKELPGLQAKGQACRHMQCWRGCNSFCNASRQK